MMTDANRARFLFKAAAGKFSVLEFKGEDFLSGPYHFRIRLRADDSGVDPGDLIKTRARLTFLTESGKSRHINGVIGRAAREEAEKNSAIYSVDLYPMFWLLGWRRLSRIFQGMSAPDIIKDVLKKGGFSTSDFMMKLSGDHPVRDYCVQHRETDLDFISRLSGEEGIFFFFSQDENRETLVFGDDISAVPKCEPESSVICRPKTGVLESNQEVLYQCGMDVTVYSGAIVLKDYNYETPAMSLSSMSVSSDHRELEVYDHPGGYMDSGRGETMAKMRRESAGFRARTLKGRGTFRCLASGHKLNVTGGSDPGLYVVCATTHQGVQTQSRLYREKEEAGITYEATFEAAPAEVPIRPPKLLRKPIVPIQTAVVTGPSGEEIYTDEHGRVKVQFHWDREGEKNEKSSCWIRVSQTWAGAGWGAIHIPRIGQEVIVDFIEGDPDRPIITGRVYNGDNLPPYPNEKTKSGIKSNTTIGGGTFNELLMDDKSGETKVVLSSAYGHKITEDEKTQTLVIETRDNNRMAMDDKNKNIAIATTDLHEVLMDDENKKISVKTTDGHLMDMDDKNRKIEASTKDGHKLLMDDRNRKIEITSKDGHNAIIDDANQSVILQDANGQHKFQIDIGGSKLLVSTETGSIDVLAPVGKVTLEAVDIEINATNELKLTAGMNVTSEAGMQNAMKGTMVNSEASAANTMKGNPVSLN